MSTSTHTPGPWYFKKNINLHDQGLVIAEKTGASIAVTYDSRDAMLIAVAPQLLEALQGVYDNAGGPFEDSHSAYFTINLDQWRKVQDALSAATQP